MEFEWDDAKNTANLAKHGIDFEDAIRIFDGPILEKADDRRNYSEVRFIAFGAVGDCELTIVYTRRGERRRIISARRAHSRERKAYRETYPKQPTAR